MNKIKLKNSQIKLLKLTLISVQAKLISITKANLLAVFLKPIKNHSRENYFLLRITIISNVQADLTILYNQEVNQMRN